MISFIHLPPIPPSLSLMLWLTPDHNRNSYAE